MNSREIVGIAIALIGLLLVPLGLFHDPKWWIAVVALVLIGFVVIRTKRVEEFEKAHGPPPVTSGGFGLHTDQIPHAPKFKGNADSSGDFGDGDGD
jgi:hypothetical protein